MVSEAWLLVAKVVGVVAVVGLVLWGVRGCQEHYRDQGRAEVQKDWDDAKREDQRIAEKARGEKERTERAKEQKMAKAAERNNHVQVQRERTLHDRAVAAESERDGLLGTVAQRNADSAARRAEGTCAAAEREAYDAATARGLLGTCAGRYSAMAKAAGELAGQVMGLQDHIVVVQPEAAAMLESAP